MKLRAGIAAAACCLSLAVPAHATEHLAGAGTWTGSGTVSVPLLVPLPMPGLDPLFQATGVASLADGRTGTCTALWWEDPSGVLAGVAFGLSANLLCDGGLASLSGTCVVTRVATVQLICLGTAATTTADLAIVPSDYPMDAFTFAGPIATTTVNLARSAMPR